MASAISMFILRTISICRARSTWEATIMTVLRSHGFLIRSSSAEMLGGMMTKGKRGENCSLKIFKRRSDSWGCSPWGGSVLFEMGRAIGLDWRLGVLEGIKSTAPVPHISLQVGWRVSLSQGRLLALVGCGTTRTGSPRLGFSGGVLGLGFGTVPCVAARSVTRLSIFSSSWAVLLLPLSFIISEEKTQTYEVVLGDLLFLPLLGGIVHSFLRRKHLYHVSQRITAW